MMHASRTSLALLAASGVSAAGAVALLLMPAIQAADARHAECGRLLAQVERREAITAERDRLGTELADARVAAERVLRAIPAAPGQAHLMRMLAVGTGPDMGTQTIVAGDVIPATPGESGGYRAIPVTVEMKASFARVMDVLARAEGDRRLVRPIRIDIQRPGAERMSRSGVIQRNTDEAGRADGLVEARLDFDAVFGTAMTSEPEEKP